MGLHTTQVELHSDCFLRWLLKPGTEWNGTERNAPYFSGYLLKFFDLGLGIPKSKFLGLGQGTVRLQGEKSGKERNGIVRSVPFRSIPFRVLVTTAFYTTMHHHHDQTGYTPYTFQRYHYNQVLDQVINDVLTDDIS